MGKVDQSEEAGVHIYRLVLKGYINEDHFQDYPSLQVEQVENTTILYGPIRDQSELRGLLNRIFNLNLSILGLYKIPESEDAANSSRTPIS